MQKAVETQKKESRIYAPTWDWARNKAKNLILNGFHAIVMFDKKHEQWCVDILDTNGCKPGDEKKR